jgi:hypothetical protein
MAGNTLGGYWLVASDDGVFSFDAAFKGSLGSITLNAPVTGMAATDDGLGYWMVTADGGAFAFGDTPFWALPPERARARRADRRVGSKHSMS